MSAAAAATRKMIGILVTFLILHIYEPRPIVEKDEQACLEQPRMPPFVCVCVNYDSIHTQTQTQSKYKSPSYCNAYNQRAGLRTFCINFCLSNMGNQLSAAEWCSSDVWWCWTDGPSRWPGSIFVRRWLSDWLALLTADEMIGSVDNARAFKRALTVSIRGDAVNRRKDWTRDRSNITWCRWADMIYIIAIIYLHS